MFRGSATSLGRPRKPSLALCLVREEPCQLPSRDAGPLVLVLVILSVCALGPAPARAQAVYGSIFGTITDQSGAAVVGAKLTVTSVQKQIRFATTSNRAGNYSLTHLIPDLYDVRSEAPGFKIVESTSIPVYADQATRLDVHLQIGGTEEKVTVSAEDIPLMKTDRSDVATTFGEKEVKSLPLFNRNFTSLELLTPGTSQFGFPGRAS